MSIKAVQIIAAHKVTAAPISPEIKKIMSKFGLKPPMKTKTSEGVRMTAQGTFNGKVDESLTSAIKSLGFECTSDSKTDETRHTIWKKEDDGLTIGAWHVPYKGRPILNITLSWMEGLKSGSPQDKHVIARKLLKFTDDGGASRVTRFKSKVTKGFRFSSSCTTIDDGSKPIYAAIKSLGFDEGKHTKTENGEVIIFKKGDVAIRVDVNTYSHSSPKETFHKFTLFTPG